MKVRLKILLCVAAFAVSGLALHDAQAGNLVLSPVQFFSVELQDNEALTYSGTDDLGIILVDDVTYSAFLQPDASEPRGTYFSPMGSFGLFYPLSPTDGWLQSSMGWDLDINWGTTNGAWQDWYHAHTRRWCDGAGIDFAAYLDEFGSNGPGGVFDRFTHSTYAEYLGRQRVIAWAQWHTRSGGGDDMGEPTGQNEATTIAGAGAGGTGVGMGVGLGMWAAESSASRHYQSPQIVQKGNSVGFVVETGSGLSPYVRARCNIKGRVIISGGHLYVPDECTDVTVAAASR